MKVLKFGGTSVGSESAIRKVTDIVKQASQTDQLVIVASAVGGITDQLVKIGELASKGDLEYENVIAKIHDIHFDLYKKLIEEAPSDDYQFILDQLSEVGKGVWLLKELTPRSSDFILSIGERLSSLMVSNYFKKQGLDVTLFDSRDHIKTDDHFGYANVNFEKTDANLTALSPSFSGINYFPGFIASTDDDETITLGRGGSDLQPPF